MKISKITLNLTVIGALILGSSSLAWSACEDGVFSEAPTVASSNPQKETFIRIPSTQQKLNNAQWRNGITQSLAQAGMQRTDFTREAWIKKMVKAMTDYLHSAGDTPEMVFVAQSGTKVQVDAKHQPDMTNPVAVTYVEGGKDIPHGHNVARIHVTGLGASGVLKGVALLPVSGHTGIANAKKWAKTDKYSLYLEKPNGKEDELVKDVLSLDLVTVQEISMTLVPGVNQLMYYRLGKGNGMGSPDGYSSGRIIEIDWDGK